MCSLFLAIPILSFAKEKKQPNPGISAYEHANKNAKFKRSQEVFNSKAHKEIRAQRLAEKKMAEAEEEKKKAEEAQDKGEGQIKVTF